MNITKPLFLAIGLLLFQCAQAQDWKTIEVTDHCTARHENSVVALGEKLILLGGRGIKPTEVFDTHTREWTKQAPTPIEINHFQAVTFRREIYVLGAFTGGFPHEQPIEHIYIFNVEKNEWRKGPDLPKDRLRGAAGCVVYQDKIYLVGGIQDGHWDGAVSWLDEYDPIENSWRTLADAPHARDHVSVGVIDGRLYVAGARRSSGITNQYLELTESAVDVYDFATDTWQTLPEDQNIPTERAGCSAVVMGQKLLILGGESASQVGAHAEVEAYNTVEMKWEALPNMVQGRHGTGAVNIDGKIFTAAGCGQRGGTPELNTIEVLE